MALTPARTALFAVAAVLVAGIIWGVSRRLSGPAAAPAREQNLPIPVEVAPLERGPIEQRRTFGGTLVASEEFVVASKVGGRVERLLVDLADTVEPGQVVAELDSEEYQQAHSQAEAELAVTRANLRQAESILEIAARALERITRLGAQGVATEVELDVVRADQLAGEAGVEVARAHIQRAEAALATARIRLGYTRVTATWREGQGPRLVANRFVDVGDTVSANAPLMTIVDLDPLRAVVYVTERDYALIQVGQIASFSTDLHPGETFQCRVERVAPVFRTASRQARVELRVENPGQRLKPGMFVRVDIVLERTDDAHSVPIEAMATHAGREGVFVVDTSGVRASFLPCSFGIRQDGRVQLVGFEPPAAGTRVITLGHQLLADGAHVHIAASASAASAAPSAAAGAP